MASKLKILALSWNMSGSDTLRTMQEWQNSFVGQQWSDWITDKTNTHERRENPIHSFDIVVVALQEVHRKSGFAKFFLHAINTSGTTKPGEMFLAAEAKNKSLARLAGYAFDQHLHVFYKVKHGFTIAKRGSTCFGAGGSCVKGSVAVHLNRQDEHYIFVNSHFPFISVDGRGDLSRMGAYRSTVDKLLLQMRTVDGVEIPMDKVNVIWGGDFNYRTNRLNVIDTGKQSVVYEDRLNTLRSSGKGPWSYNLGWRDGDETKQSRNFKPSYEPTFRLVQLPKTASSKEIFESGQLRYLGSKKAYSLLRDPAWCDRIFTKPVAKATLSCRTNKFSTGSVESDHDAVFAEITLSNIVVGKPLVQSHIEEWHEVSNDLAFVFADLMEIPVCSVCARATQKMLSCEKCGQHYCGSECQVWDWTNEEHSTACANKKGETPHIDRVYKRSRKGAPSPEKAHEMLKNPPHGHITPRQQRYFGWIWGSRNK
jgi:hypothetical protein